MTTLRSVFTGVGSWLPEKVIWNADFPASLQTSDEWIQQRTGIRCRHIAATGELTSSLAIRAAQAALTNADLLATAIDAIVLATTTPDSTFPATAARVQALLGTRPGIPAWDVQAVCSGFVFALVQADNMIRLRQAQRVLVIGAEIYSRIVDWTDRSTCVLFGDGAGAVVLEARQEADGRGVLATTLGTDGAYYDKLYVDGGVATTGTSGHVRMEGREVFRHAVQRMSESVEKTLALAGLTLADVSWLVPHQANARIIAKVGEKLGISNDRILLTVEEHANISSATIPVALAHGVRAGLFASGDLLALTAMGGGFAWGGALVRW